MKRKTIVKQCRRAALAACGRMALAAGALMIGSWVMQSCKDDVLTGQPSWLGNSIYERLQEEGNYTTTLRLIDDLELKEVLGHTGSKTLFAASDSAYQQWFKTNAWGVRSYDQLTLAQKKLLLNNSMINNAYLIELMSNVSGTPPEEGKAMRRETAASILDSVAIMRADDMPNTAAWEDYKSRGKSIPIFKDGTAAPMIHFLPAYMTYNKITSEDLAILTNHKATSINEAWVNGKRVVERDITCKNGYIHKVDGVIESSPNMAEILRQHPQMSMWSHLVDRFSAPYFHFNGTRDYNRMYNNEDSVYTLRYYSRRSLGGEANSRTPKGDNVSALLKFDPGWNHYINNTSGYDLHYDAGAMLVPTNEALAKWWDNEGRDLQDEYKTWDSIPDATLAKLINVNMLDVFSSTVPSKFPTVLNDAKDVLGITKEDVDSCFMGCNGVVYMVNRVFTPAEYSSVAYPALAHESTMNIIYWVIDQLNFLPYLLSMDSQYALLLPSNNAMSYYYDPAHYGETNLAGEEQANQIAFVYDPRKPLENRIQATRYQTTIDENGEIIKTNDFPLEDKVDESYQNKVITTMLNDLMDQLIIVIPDKSKTLEQYVAEGYSLFKTKGGSLIRVTKADNGNLAFEGGWQMEHNHKKIVATEVFQKTNGRSYMLEDQMPLGAQKTLYLTLKEHPEYTGFFNLLENDYSNLLSVRLNNKYSRGNEKTGSKNLRLFDNYNYTVFIPSTESIERLQAQDKLPKWNELLKYDGDTDVLDSICLAEGWYTADTEKQRKDSVALMAGRCLTDIVVDFVRYHVMDRSVAVGMAPEMGMEGAKNYESMKRNPETGKFFPLNVSYDQNGIQVKDAMNNVRQVNTTEGLYNNICREYWFDKDATKNYSEHLFMASSAVAHLIDEPLYFQEMKPWRQVVKEYLANYNLLDM